MAGIDFWHDVFANLPTPDALPNLADSKVLRKRERSHSVAFSARRQLICMPLQGACQRLEEIESEMC